MFSEIIDKEIKNDVVPLKSLREVKDLESQFLSWLRHDKLPVEDVSFHDYTKVIESTKKSRGVKPLFISNFYLNRLIDDSYDVLGAIVKGRLAEEISLMHKKACYILPKPYPNLPHKKADSIFIWVPPASFLSNSKEGDGVKKTELLQQTMLDYNFNLGDYYIVLPKNFLSDKNIKNLRNKFLEKTCHAIILKYKSYFNAVILKISNKNEPKDKILCKFFVEDENSKGVSKDEAYKMYFKTLASEFEVDEFKADWILEKSSKKISILLNSNIGNTIGNFINIIAYNKSKRIDVMLPKGVGLTERHYINLKKFPTHDSKEFNSSEEPVNDMPVSVNKVSLGKNDFILKSRAPLTIDIPPTDSDLVFLPNHYYVIKPIDGNALDQKQLMNKVQHSIIQFCDRYLNELDSLGVVSFDLLRQIPLLE